MMSATSRPRVYELYGLRVRSEICLDAPTVSARAIDLSARWGVSRRVPAEPPPGELLADLRLANGSGYTHTRTTAGYTLRFYGTCEVRLDRARRSARVHLDPDADPGLVPILIGGNVLAFILTLAGECVLHASAVAVGDGALAFAGGTGSGKSTLAALLCASGAMLVTDDLLRVEPVSGRCFPGARQIRLRQSATDLTRRFPAAATRPTADQRLAVQLRDSPVLPVRLRAVVIPRRSRACRTLRLERLSLPNAAFRLTGCARVAWWRASEQIRQHFERAGHVAARIPVYEAEIPWDPPFAPELAGALLAGVGLDRSLVESSA
jgi:hypothetical protein